MMLLAFVPIYRLMDTSADAPHRRISVEVAEVTLQASVVGHDRDPASHMAFRTPPAQLDECREPTRLTGSQVPTALQFRGNRTHGEPDGHSEEDRQRDEDQGTPAAWIAVAVQENTTFLMTNHRLAGLSARRLIYHGSQAVP